MLDFASRFQSASALVLDAHVEGFGGGGKVFDWSLIPPSVPAPVVLSGGLDAANVIDEYFSGKKLTKEVLLPLATVTKANVAQWEAPCTY